MPANLFEIAGGDYIVDFHSLLFGINSNLYAQRYNAGGNPVWANAIQLADKGTAFNATYSGLQDGDVVYMGYFASVGTRFDSFLQRINPDGTLLWGINGADFDISDIAYEMDTEVAFKSGSQDIWTVSTYLNPTQTERGEYVQKFDKLTGVRQLTNKAKEVFPIGSDISHVGKLQLRNGNPLFLIEEGENNSVAPTTFRAVHLVSNGDFAWPQESLPIATFAASKKRVVFT